MSWNAGTRLTHELTLVEPLAEGAMGQLWVAEHAGLRARVAIKFLSPKLVSDKAARGRFRREAEAAMQLRSPFVVRLHAHGTSDSRQPFLVFELLEGESLGTLLQREERLDLDETLRLVRQIGAALEEAHGHGIVHRDIKADNIFVVDGPDGPVAKVLDFGMAKRTQVRSGSVVTATGVIVGTPEYMSPEQVLGSKQVDHRTDLWALGVLSYRALLGMMPFDAVSPGELVFAICRGQFRRPSELYLPKPLDEWFNQALAPDVEKRFGSATELVMALERLAATSGLAEAIENGLCALPTMVKPSSSWREAARAIQAAKRGAKPGSLSSVTRRRREVQALAETVASPGLDGDTDERVSTQRTVERRVDRKVERRTLRYVPQRRRGVEAAGDGSPSGDGQPRTVADAAEPSQPERLGPWGNAFGSGATPSSGGPSEWPPSQSLEAPSGPGGLPAAAGSGPDAWLPPASSPSSSSYPPGFAAASPSHPGLAAGSGRGGSAPSANGAPPSRPSARSLPPWARAHLLRAAAGSTSTGGPTVVLGSRDGGQRAANRKLGYGVAVLVAGAVAAITALVVGAVVLAGVDPDASAAGEPAPSTIAEPAPTAAPPASLVDASATVETSEPTDAAASAHSEDASSGVGGSAAPSATRGARSVRPGYLTLDCKPACMQVVVDGRSLGPSPVAGAPLQPGRKRIVLRRRGRPNQTVEIEIVSGRLARRLVVAP